MSESNPPEFGINSWLEDELYQEYLHDRRTVDESWKKVFESNGEEAPAGTNGGANGTHPVSVLDRESSETLPIPIPEHQPVAGETLIPLRGAAARIAENMNASLSIPVATSQRVIPVKVIDENRRIMNEHRTLLGKSKISYTHIIGWAVVKAIRTNPTLNHAYARRNGQPFRARARPQVNLGIAVDVAGKDGTRSLTVPNIKERRRAQLRSVCGGLRRCRGAGPQRQAHRSADFEGTTISLTNPGTVGTVGFGSAADARPRRHHRDREPSIIRPSIRASTEQMRAMLGLSKVMTVTCTYDHRVIQGAESGMFLGRLAGSAARRRQILRRDVRGSEDPSQTRALGSWTAPVSIPGVRGAQLE